MVGHPLQHRAAGSHGVSGHKAAASGQRAHGEGLVAVEQHPGRPVRPSLQPEGEIGGVFLSLPITRLGGCQVAIYHCLSFAGEVLADNIFHWFQVEAGQPGGNA